MICTVKLLMTLLHLSLAYHVPKLSYFHSRLSSGRSLRSLSSVHSRSDGDDGRTLVIVESPAKARTIQKIVGDSSKYIIDFCAGHVRDLATGRKDFPTDFEPTTIYEPLRLRNIDVGVDVNQDFKPFYVPIKGKAEIIKRLKETSKNVDRILLATDEDREGESISWHLVDLLKPKVPFQRAVFHEITKSAIEKAFQEPREIDYNLVNAQETRRILDKLAGFTLSPVLWKHVSAGVSAGRVQSCGLYLITERERERWAFKSSKYYSVTSAFEAPVRVPGGQGVETVAWEAKLSQWRGQRVADEKDFDGESGGVKSGKHDDGKLVVLNKELATEALDWLTGADGNHADFVITDKTERSTSRQSPPPFITSTLQQVASRKLGFSPSRTMSIAQALYESGHITYMRTDSTTLSTEAQLAIKNVVSELYGAEYLVGKSNAKASNAGTPKNAQEAHEAIRPAQVNGRFKLRHELDIDSVDSLALYDLILRRTLASAMRPSKTTTVSLTITARKPSSDADTTAVFRASESTIADPGFLLCMEESRFRGLRRDKASGQPGYFNQLQRGQSLQLSPSFFSASKTKNALHRAALVDDAEGEGVEEEGVLAGEGGEAVDEDAIANVALDANAQALANYPGMRCAEHTTRAPSRFTEASFIKELETVGVGRPSTYSSIFSILKDRGYIIVDRQTIIPTGVGIAVSQFMAQHFPQIVDENFTADMEKALDRIARGEDDKVAFLNRFYFGTSNSGVSGTLANVHESLPAKKKKASVDLATVGLLPKVTDVLAADNARSRVFSVPSLAHLGEFFVYKSGLYFSFFQETGDHQSDSSPVNNSTSASMALRKKLPGHMESDLRTWTEEAINAVRGDASFIPTDGVVVGEQRNASDALLRYTLREGVYGKFLFVEVLDPGRDVNLLRLINEDMIAKDDVSVDEVKSSQEKTKKAPKVKKAALLMNKQIPSWVTDDLSLADAADFASLPKQVGTLVDDSDEDPAKHVRRNISLSIVKGKLRLSAENYPYQAELPPHVYVRDVTSEMAVEALRISTIPNDALKISLGMWFDEEVLIRTGAFGPYVQCASLFVSLPKDTTPDAMTLDMAINRLQWKMRKIERTGGKMPAVMTKLRKLLTTDQEEQKKTSKTKATDSDPDSDDDSSSGENQGGSRVKKTSKKSSTAKSATKAAAKKTEVANGKADTVSKRATSKTKASSVSSKKDESAVKKKSSAAVKATASKEDDIEEELVLSLGNAFSAVSRPAIVMREKKAKVAITDTKKTKLTKMMRNSQAEESADDDEVVLMAER